MRFTFRLEFYNEKEERVFKIDLYATRRQVDKIFFAMAFGFAYSTIHRCDLCRVGFDGSTTPLNSFRVFGGIKYV